MLKMRDLKKFYCFSQEDSLIYEIAMLKCTFIWTGTIGCNGAWIINTNKTKCSKTKGSVLHFSKMSTFFFNGQTKSTKTSHLQLYDRF